MVIGRDAVVCTAADTSPTRALDLGSGGIRFSMSNSSWTFSVGGGGARRGAVEEDEVEEIEKAGASTARSIAAEIETAFTSAIELSTTICVAACGAVGPLVVACALESAEACATVVVVASASEFSCQSRHFARRWYFKNSVQQQPPIRVPTT